MTNKELGTAFVGTVDELKEAIKKANKLLKKENGAKKNNQDLTKLKALFYQWKEKVDKIMLDNKVDTLYSEHEFYDHIVALNNWVNEGKKFEDMFGTEEELWNSDNLIITYDIVNDIIDAINNCYYEITQFENDWLFENQKVMIIDYKYSLELVEQQIIDMKN